MQPEEQGFGGSRDSGGRLGAERDHSVLGQREEVGAEWVIRPVPVMAAQQANQIAS